MVFSHFVFGLRCIFFNYKLCSSLYNDSKLLNELLGVKHGDSMHDSHCLDDVQILALIELIVEQLEERKARQKVEGELMSQVTTRYSQNGLFNLV